MATLDDDIREADKLGISYGKYKSKQEELKMARGYKTSDTDKQRVLDLARAAEQSGTPSYKAISLITGVPSSTVRDIIKADAAKNAVTKEKEPETAATVSGSVTNKNIPTDIIPESTEKVKENFIPDAVREACFEAKERYQAEIREVQQTIDGYTEYISQIDEFLGRFE